MIDKITYGFVLSGGGARGVAHLGVLKAFEERGIKPSGISGTSAGAIVGAMYASGYSPDEILEIIIKAKFFTSLRPAMSFSGLLQMESLGKLFSQYLKNDFSSLKIPLTVATTDLKHGTTKYFSEGTLIKPLLAASCIPVVFKPVDIKGIEYVDGGMLNNLPVEPLIGEYDKIVGVHTNPIHDDFQGTNAKTIIERCLLMAVSGNIAQRADKCDIYIEPDELGKFSGMDLTKAQQIFDLGYTFTKENIDNFDL